MRRGAGLVCGVLVTAIGATPVLAVKANGPSVRVDVPVAGYYGYYRYRLAVAGGQRIAVAWEENTVEDNPFIPVPDALKARVFNAALTPLAAPQKAEYDGRLGRGLSGLIRLDDNLFYLVGVHARKLDQSTQTDFYGQTLNGSGGTLDPRRLLNVDSLNGGAAVGGVAGLNDRGGIFGWYNGVLSSANPTAIPARFVSRKGAPGAVSENLALPVPAGLTNLKPLDTGFAAVYTRLRDGFPMQQLVRLFNAAANPLGPAKVFDGSQDARRQVVGLADGHVLVAERTTTDNVVFTYSAQIYSKAWDKIGRAIAFIKDGHSTETQVYAPMPDGGLLVGRTYLENGVYSHSVTRFDAALKRNGTPYVFPSAGFDSGFAIDVLNATTGIIVYRNGTTAAEPGIRLRRLKL